MSSCIHYSSCSIWVYIIYRNLNSGLFIFLPTTRHLRYPDSGCIVTWMWYFWHIWISPGLKSIITDTGVYQERERMYLNVSLMLSYLSKLTLEFWCKHLGQWTDPLKCSEPFLPSFTLETASIPQYCIPFCF